MTSRDLNKLLDDKFTVENFKATIADEVKNFGRLINKSVI